MWVSEAGLEKECNFWANEMTQWVKGLAAKPDDPEFDSWNLHSAGRKLTLANCLLDSFAMCFLWQISDCIRQYQVYRNLAIAQTYPQVQYALCKSNVYLHVYAIPISIATE